MPKSVFCGSAEALVEGSRNLCPGKWGEDAADGSQAWQEELALWMRLRVPE